MSFCMGVMDGHDGDLHTAMAELRQDCDKGATTDAVAHPSHYTQGGIECIDAMKAMMGDSHCIQECARAGAARYNITPIGFYWWGCAFKYLWRWTSKNGIEDLRKCRQCIDFLIEEVERDEDQVD